MGEGGNKREHIYYFDYLRIIGLVSVIFMHTAAAPLRAQAGTADWQLTSVFTSFAFTAVPLFLMMSGYLTLSSEKTRDYGYILKNRLPRLVCTLAVWTAAASLWLAFSGGGNVPRSFIIHLLSGFSRPVMVHFWYMYTLIALTVVSPFLYLGLAGLDRTGRTVTAACIALVLLQTAITCLLPQRLKPYGAIDLFYALRLFGGSLSAYLLGWFLGNMKKRIPNAALIAVFAADLCVIAVGTALRSAAGGEYDASFQSQSGGFEILLASCIFLFFRQNFNRESGFRRALAPMVQLSLGIYLVHNIFVSMAGAAGFTGTGFIYTCAKTLCVLLASYLTVKTLASVKILCWPFTGVSFAAACRGCSWQYTFRRRRDGANGDKNI